MRRDRARVIRRPPDIVVTGQLRGDVRAESCPPGRPIAVGSAVVRRRYATPANGGEFRDLIDEGHEAVERRTRGLGRRIADASHAVDTTADSPRRRVELEAHAPNIAGLTQDR